MHSCFGKFCNLLLVMSDQVFVSAQFAMFGKKVQFSSYIVQCAVLNVQCAICNNKFGVSSPQFTGMKSITQDCVYHQRVNYSHQVLASCEAERSWGRPQVIFFLLLLFHLLPFLLFFFLYIFSCSSLPSLPSSLFSWFLLLVLLLVPPTEYFHN